MDSTVLTDANFGPYHFVRHIGYGAFSEVWEARNMNTNEKVAVKCIRNLLTDINVAKHTLREIRLLRHFDHENILAIKDIFITGTKDDFNEIFIVSELMGTDLHKLISSKRKLQDEHLQTFIYQILRGLKCVHSARVFHRDLKPNNILINSNCDLKICDFGTGRGVGRKQLNMTLMEYVTTRWYRPPEGLMLATHYTSAVDVWSVGCILAELILRRPLFPGKHNYDQLDQIFSVLGTPPKEQIDKIQNEKYRNYLKNIPDKESKSFKEIFSNANPQAIDMIERMLVLDPEKRLTVDEALVHPYLAPLHDPEDEPMCAKQFDDDFDEESIQLGDFRELIFSEATKTEGSPQSGKRQVL
jgi:mitogen-activated protein kinase 1/3